jgi:hypothetical protein
MTTTTTNAAAALVARVIAETLRRGESITIPSLGIALACPICRDTDELCPAHRPRRACPARHPWGGACDRPAGHAGAHQSGGVNTYLEWDA